MKNIQNIQSIQDKDEILATSSEVTNEVIVPFLKWANQEFFATGKVTKKQIVASISGLAIGGVAAYVMYQLGAGFGDILYAAIDAKYHVNNDEVKKFFHNFFGTNTLIPMIALGAIAAQDRLRGMVTPSSPQESQIIKQNRRILRQALKVVAHILGVFSAIPVTYLTYKYLEDSVWRFIITPPSFLAPLLFNSDSEVRLINKGFNHFSQGGTELIKSIRSYLHGRVATAMRIISEMPDEQLDKLVMQVLGKKRKKGSKEDIETPENNAEKQLEKLLEQNENLFMKSKLKLLFNLKDNEKNNKVAENKDQATCCNIEKLKQKTKQTGRVIVGGAGFALGVAGSYIYYMLGEQAVDYFFDDLKKNYDIEVEPEVRYGFKQLVGWLAYISNAPLSAERLEILFESFYDRFVDGKKSMGQTSHPKLRRVVKGVSIFEGICASSSMTFVALKAAIGGTWWQKALVVPTFLAPACVRSKAMEQLLNRGVDAVDDFALDSRAIRQDNLIKIVFKVDEMLSRLKDEQIISIYEDLIENKPETLIKMKIETSKDVPTESSPLIINQQKRPSYEDDEQETLLNSIKR